MSNEDVAQRRKPRKGGYRGFWAAQLTDRHYLERFYGGSLVTENGCIVWQGHTNQKGYGEVTYRNKRYMLHRLIYTLKVGDIPDGMLVCHKCDVRACINHEHLWLGKPADNSLDMVKKGRCHEWTRTHCPQGHEYNEENTAWKTAASGRPARECKACTRLRMQSPEYRAKANERQRRRRELQRLQRSVA